MMWIAIFTFFLLTGYFLYGRSLEKNWEIDIYRDQSTWQEDESIISHFGFRYVQLAQFAVFLSFEALISAVYGYIYGLAYISWLIIGTTFFGGVLSYYGGMYALRHRGYSLNYIIKQKFGPLAHFISTLFLLGLVAVILSDAFSSFNAAYSGEMKLPENLLLVYCVIVALFFCFCTARQMAVVFSGVGIFALIALILLFLGSKWQLQFIEYGAHNFVPQELKYAYPLSFFVVALGSVNCLQGLQASLLAPMVKNEKVGRRIFFGASTFQAFFLIMLNTLIAAWNPNMSDFYRSIMDTSTPYTYLQNLAFGAGGKKATLLMFALAITLFLSFVGVMARLARNLIAETKIGKIKFLSAIMAMVLVILPVYWLKSHNIGFAYAVIYAQIGGLFSCFVLVQYLKKHRKKYYHLVWPGLLVGGALLAYVMLILLKLDLLISDVAGCSILLLPCLTYYLNKHKDSWQEKWLAYQLKKAEKKEIISKQREEKRLLALEAKRKKQEEIARLNEQKALEKKQKNELKKQEKENRKKASLALLTAQDETEGSSNRELELAKEIASLQAERAKIESRVKEIEQELEKEQSKRLLFETSESVVKNIEQQENNEISNQEKTVDLPSADELFIEVENEKDALIENSPKFDFENETEETFDFITPVAEEPKAEKQNDTPNLPPQNKSKKKRNRKKKGATTTSQAN